MAAYLTRLWDEYSRIVLENTRDFDARDDDYETRVAAKVWATVKALREKRTDFRELILKDIEDKKKTEPET